MKSFLALVKLLFFQQFKSKQTGEKKNNGIIIAFIVLGVCALPMIVGIVIALFGVGKLMGAHQGTVAFLILTCQAFVLLLGISSLIVGVFMPKDAEKLLYLPIKPSTIFLAKLTVAYLNEVITTAITVVALLLPYGIGASMGVGYYLMLIPALLLIPLLPILIGTIIAMPISLLLTRIGSDGVGKTLLRVLFFCIFMGVYFLLASMLGKMEASVPDGEITTEMLVQMINSFIGGVSDKMMYVHTDYVLAGAMIATSFASWISNFALTLVEFALLACIAFFLAKPFYRYMLAGQIEGGGATPQRTTVASQRATKKIGKRSVIKQLVITDFKRTIRDSQMGFQAFAGLIIMPLIIVMMSFALNADPEMGFDQLLQDPLFQLIAPIALVAYLTLLGAGTNVLGLYPISRENNSFYILKSLPVAFEKVLLAKVSLSTVVMVIVDLSVVVLSVIMFGIKWYFGIGMLLVLALTGFGCMCITTQYDLKHPILGWSNFNQSLKNAKNTWIAMLVCVIIMIVISIVAGLFIVLYSIVPSGWVVFAMWAVLAGIAFLFAFVSYKIMANGAQKHFDNIEC